MTLRGRLADRVPAPISLRLRGKRSVRRVFGLHPPADLITSLVPTGKNAIDVSANRGVYAIFQPRMNAALG